MELVTCDVSSMVSKALILKENPCAFYIHCFAHQLQPPLVAVAKKHIQIASLFSLLASVVNVIRASSKRCDILQKKQAILLGEELGNGEKCSGRGQHQQTALRNPSDTRWGSHYDTLLRLINMFTLILGVLEAILDDTTSCDQRCEANNLLVAIQSFEFIFNLHMMRIILGIINELSKALQREDQDIVNAMCLVKVCKQQLQKMRYSGWDYLLNEVSSFCGKHNIEVPRTDEILVAIGRPRRKSLDVTNLHRYKEDLFYAVIDTQLQELNDRFTEVNSDLLLSIACLCPKDSFFSFDKTKMISFAKYYLDDFSELDLMTLDDQLETYFFDVSTSKEFVD